MKYYKTNSNQRATYTYVGSDGRKVTLTPGRDGVTEEDIRLLHQMDDNEVYNNNKQAKPPVQDWEKPMIEAWKESHPEEDLPVRRNVSLDQIMKPDDSEMDGDKNSLLLGISTPFENEVPADIERLREVVQMLTPEQQELYRRVILAGMALADAGAEMGLTESAVKKRMVRIREAIKKKF